MFISEDQAIPNNVFECMSLLSFNFPNYFGRPYSWPVLFHWYHNVLVRKDHFSLCCYCIQFPSVGFEYEGNWSLFRNYLLNIYSTKYCPSHKREIRTVCSFQQGEENITETIAQINITQYLEDLGQPLSVCNPVSLFCT